MRPGTHKEALIITINKRSNTELLSSQEGASIPLSGAGKTTVPMAGFSSQIQSA
jgi:hypothetical protein